MGLNWIGLHCELHAYDIILGRGELSGVEICWVKLCAGVRRNAREIVLGKCLEKHPGGECPDFMQNYKYPYVIIIIITEIFRVA